MAAILEGKIPGDWLVHEGGSYYSREQGTLLAGSGAVRNLKTGDVLGRVLTAGATSAPGAGNTGNGAMGTVTVGAGAKPGVYRLVFIEPGTDAGEFMVEDPDGVIVGTGTVAVAFSGGGLSFTLADGATDFVSGDSFAITVAAGSGKYVPLTIAGTDGRQWAAGILLNDKIVPDGADAEGVAIVRHATVNRANLGWPSGATSEQKAAAEAQLANLGIIVRDGD